MKGTNYSGAVVKRKANGQPNCNKLETFEHYTDVLKEPIRKHMSSLYSPNMMENVFSARLNIFTKIVYTTYIMKKNFVSNFNQNVFSYQKEIHLQTTNVASQTFFIGRDCKFLRVKVIEISFLLLV